MSKQYLAIGAHPDDMEIRMGGAIWKLCRAGHNVKIVSLANGNAGHHVLSPEALAARRKNETGMVAKLAGLAEYEVWDIDDGRLEVTLPNRERLIRMIRKFNADVVFTFRTCDYHADHRATAQLVQDASYLIGVPLICPDTPVPKNRPVILFTYDNFRKPCAFSPDIALAIDDVLVEKAKLVACHVSQIFEWLPYDRGELGSVPSSPEARIEWLKINYLSRNKVQADTFRELLRRRYGEKSAGIEYAETFEVSEYGRQPETDELNALLPD